MDVPAAWRARARLNGKMLHPIKGSYSFFYLILNAIITALFHIGRANAFTLKFVPTALAINQARGTRTFFLLLYVHFIYCTAPALFIANAVQLFFSLSLQQARMSWVPVTRRFVRIMWRNCDGCVLLNK